MKILECWINTSEAAYYFNCEVDQEIMKAMLLYKAKDITSITVVETMKKEEFEKMMGVENDLKTDANKT